MFVMNKSFRRNPKQLHNNKRLPKGSQSERLELQFLELLFNPKGSLAYKYIFQMNNEKSFCSEGNTTPTSTCAYDTGVQETIDGLLDLVNSLNLEISKERDCKNKAYFFILENGLIKDFQQFKPHSNNPIEFINNLKTKK